MNIWVDFGSNGFRRFNEGELRNKYMQVDEGVIYRFEEEVQLASGTGGTISVVRPYFVFAPVPPREER